MDLREVPPHTQLQVQVLLAKCFRQHSMLPNALDLAGAGFTDPHQLIEIGWITKTPGRWSSSYQPSDEISALINDLNMEESL